MSMRYAFGGDEHIFVEVDEAMSLDAFFKSLAMTKAVRESAIAGITEICPANASFQIKYDPDVIAPDDLLAQLKRLEQGAAAADSILATRIIEMPVLYDDPWTTETLMRFRERHQDPSGTDLDYAARINGYASVADFIAAHSGAPWFVSMVGFVAGLPFLYQMVARDKQIQVPKYLRPRTDTPKLTIGHGGCFSAIYSVRGAGGYQMFGITPMPIYDPAQAIGYLRDFMIFFKPGDIVKFKPVTREGYDAVLAGVADGSFVPNIKPVTFSLADFKADPAGTNARLLGCCMALEFVKPGLATTVQDLGRPGYYHLGIPLSGGMDRFALAAANRLVGNEEGDATLEIVFLGPEIRFAQDAIIAVTGADLPPKIDGVAQPTWTTLAIKAGQVLSFAFLKTGARAYLAIAGGIDVPLVLGSRATYPLGALGGFEGRALRAGDTLALGPAKRAVAPGTAIPADLRRGPGADPVLRVLPGLYWHRITAEAGRHFFADTWKVAPEADRIGYRFRGGRPLDFVPREPPFGAGSDPSNIVDSCYPYGSIQVPGGTEPIVLHRDAVSGGGYFMIGTVIAADMDLIGQLQPNQTARFAAVTMDEALAARRMLQALAARVRESV